MNPADILLEPEPAADEGIRSSRVPLIAYATDRESLAVLTEVLAPALGSAAEFRLGGMAFLRLSASQQSVTARALGSSPMQRPASTAQAWYALAPLAPLF